jgi:hypothetical protein
MHYVQGKIFERELQAILGGRLNVGLFENDGKDFTSATAKIGSARVHGFRAATEFHSFLRTLSRYREEDMEADEVLIEISLDLNQTVYPPQIKDCFVDRIGTILQSGTPARFHDLGADLRLGDAGAFLSAQVLACRRDGAWDAQKLLKLLKIIPIDYFVIS